MMKTFRKLIALVLVVAMVSSVFTFSASAKFSLRPAADEPVVARMYIAHLEKPSATEGHTWIYIENLTNESIYVGAYYRVPKNQGVSIGTYGESVDAGPGLYYNVEAWRYQNKDIYGPITYSIHKDLTEKQLEKVNKTIRSINHWSKLRNCAHAAMKIWNSVPGTHMVYIFLPLFHLMQIRSKKDCVNGYLKMKASNLKNNTWKQVGRGDNATIEYTDPKPVEYQN